MHLTPRELERIQLFTVAELARRRRARKQSGIGSDLSRYGFDDYTRIKHVMAAHVTP
ncbi:urease subunit gamma [Streptomyces sp. NPDC056656]|uniref:urease subunit gamma n=1 Tax=Streptomyces sp. NPDC056656 TaxID=3345895 RepID=UPI0036A69E3D